MKNKFIMENEIAKKFEKWTDFKLLKGLIDADTTKQINRYFYFGFIGFEVAIVMMFAATYALPPHSLFSLMPPFLMLISLWAMLKADKLLKFNLKPILESMGFEAATVEKNIESYQREVLFDIFNNQILHSKDNLNKEVKDINAKLIQERHRVKNSKFNNVLPLSIVLAIISILVSSMVFKDTVFILISVIGSYIFIGKIYDSLYELLCHKYYKTLYKISRFLPDVISRLKGK